MEPIRFLAYQEMEMIHGRALRILERVGVRVEHSEALKYLQQAGCRVDFGSRTARFPAAVVEGAVARMKSRFADQTRLPKRMSVRYS